MASTSLIHHVRRGLWQENPVLVLLLGMCPTLATTSNASNALAMGLATLFVLCCSTRHNMRYWLGADYLGFGPGAHSYLHGTRFETAPDRGAYLAAVEQGAFATLRQNASVIAGKEKMDEYVMLRMRLFEGLDLQDFTSRFGITFREEYGDVTPLIKGGFLTCTNGRLAFTEGGMRVSNAILSEWLDFGK